MSKYQVQQRKWILCVENEKIYAKKNLCNKKNRYNFSKTCIDDDNSV